MAFFRACGHRRSEDERASDGVELHGIGIDGSLLAVVVVSVTVVVLDTDVGVDVVVSDV